MISLIVTLVIDTSIVKVYDLVDKSFISERDKFLLFSINTSIMYNIRIYHNKIFTNFI